MCPCGQATHGTGAHLPARTGALLERTGRLRSQPEMRKSYPAAVTVIYPQALKRRTIRRANLGGQINQ